MEVGGRRSGSGSRIGDRGSGPAIGACSKFWRMLGALMAVMLAQSSGIDYGALVQEYRSGHAEEAVTRLAALGPRATWTAGFKSFMRSGRLGEPADDRRGDGDGGRAPAAHPDDGERARSPSPAGRWRSSSSARDPECGSASPASRRRSSVSAQFRRLWFLAVITAMEWQRAHRPRRRRISRTRAALFPQDAEMLLLSGIARGDARVEPDRRTPARASGGKPLASAEVYYARITRPGPGSGRDAAPPRMGALRSAGVPTRRARSSTAVSDVPDARLAYLGSLFLGGLEDAGRQHRRGRALVRARRRHACRRHRPRASAAASCITGPASTARRQKPCPPATGSRNTSDPWWTLSLRRILEARHLPRRTPARSAGHETSGSGRDGDRPPVAGSGLGCPANRFTQRCGPGARGRAGDRRPPRRSPDSRRTTSSCATTACSQTIDAIAIESLPLTVTFVLDTSGSVAGDKMRQPGVGGRHRPQRHA